MDELVRAFELIKNECKKRQHCEDCPCGTEDGECIVNTVQPADWNVGLNTVIRVVR